MFLGLSLVNVNGLSLVNEILPGKFIRCLLFCIFWVTFGDIDWKINLGKYCNDSLFSMLSAEATSSFYYKDQL